jgi:GWxTD domain-containing protein
MKPGRTWRKAPLTALAAVFALAAGFTAGAPQKTKLPERYLQWLEEEAVYIISPVERDVFLKLQSDRERDLFIEAFWKQRDPTPGTPGNEFRAEHGRRLAHANRVFGRDATRAGWRTDRGRIYIILGEPQEIQRYEGRSGVHDAEVWFYQGKTGLGLPSGFNLVFFRPHGHGEFRLYSPIGDGPQALLTGYFGRAGDYQAAYEKLREIEPGLAAVSLSLVPGEETGAYGRPSLGSDLLIQRIETAPVRTVTVQYAQKFLEYKDIVEVEYTANYIESEALVKVFRDPMGLYFVHYALEPARLSVNLHDDTYYTTLKVNGRVTTLDGRLVFQFDKSVSLEMTEEEMRDASRAPFNFQDLFPLVAGDYRLSVLVKNEASKEFTSAEQALRVPQGGADVQLTQPLLGYRTARLEPGQRTMRAFRLGSVQVYCQPGRVFSQQETLAVAFQVNNLTEELAREGEVRIELLKDGQPFRDLRRRASDHRELPDILEEIPLADLPPAHYKVRVSFLVGGAEVVSAAEEFDLSFAEAVPRPWFSSRVLPDAGDPVYSEIVGAQLFNLGRFAESRIFLERAFAKKPGSPDTAVSLGRVYLALDDPEAVLRVVTPFLDRPETAKYELYLLAGEARGRVGDLAGAIEVLDRAVSHYGVNALLLNAIGNAYAGMGMREEALAAYERSLQLSPDQPEVRKKAEALRKKRP